MSSRQVKEIYDSIGYPFYQLVHCCLLKYYHYGLNPVYYDLESTSNWDRCKRAKLRADGLYSSLIITKHFLSRYSLAVVSSHTMLIMPLSNSSLVFSAVGFYLLCVLRHAWGFLDILIMGRILCWECFFWVKESSWHCCIVNIVFYYLFHCVGDCGKIKKLMVLKEPHFGVMLEQIL